MATLTIRNLPDSVRDELRQRAAAKGLSMEAEVRRLISEALGSPNSDARQANWERAISDAQEAFSPFRNPKVSAVDELIADRRLEAWRETVEGYEWLNRHGSDNRFSSDDPCP